MTIRSKLIIYTFISISLTLIIVGVSINSIITELYNNNAQTELDRSYQDFKKNISDIKNNIRSLAIETSTNKPVIALTNLVSRYQNIENYQPLIFDNDKKKIAHYLLKQISRQGSDLALLYSKEGDLIAYAAIENKLKIAGITSYINGKAVNISNIDYSNQWLTTDLAKNIPDKIPPLSNQISFLSHAGKVKFITKNNKFIIEHNRVISRLRPQNKIELLGIIHISKSLDTAFFKQSNQQAGTEISLLLSNGESINPRKDMKTIKNIASVAQIFSDSQAKETKLITDNSYYVQPYIWPTKSGNNYLFITLSRENLITAIKQTRLYLFIVFIVVATLIIIISIYWLNWLISIPLQALTEKTKLTKKGKYPVFPVSKANDEISTLGKVLNKMVATIKIREKELTKGTKRLQNAQRLAKVGDWELIHKSDKMVWSDETFKIFDYTKGKITPSPEAIRKRCHPDDLELTQNVFQQSLLTKTPYNLTHRIITDDNKIRYINVYGETDYDENNLPAHTVGTIQDVTKQITTDEQLRRTQKMNALGKLTGGIAHDFNNMLGVILGYAELLESSEKLSDKDKKYIKEIIHAGHRSSKLTSKLLSFSRKDTPAAIPTDINKLVTDEKHMLEKTLTARIQLMYELGNDIWQVLLDKDELEDAIINISINAMHAMESGGTLTISTKNCHFSDYDLQSQEINLPAGDYVELSLIDTGTGMDQDTVQQIFEPFFTTKDDKGTGLGLSQVYGFVQRSNAAIQVHSAHNVGTRISIYFPRYMEFEELKNIDSVTTQIDDSDLSGSATILVVDDEESIQFLNNELLSSQGYKVICADSGKMALEILKTEHIDLMLSDVIMPNMDGYELSSIVQKQYPEIKIQILSGFSTEPTNDSSINNLYKNRIQKPFASDILLKRVKELLLEN